MTEAIEAVKGGKKSIKTKTGERKWAGWSDPFQNPLQLDDAVKAAFKEEELEVRFINLKKWKENSGFNANSWEPYSPKEHGKIEGLRNDPNGSSDGRVIRGDLILAVRPIFIGNRARARKQKRNEAQKMFNRDQAVEMERISAQGKHKAKILEGYDENDPNKVE